MRASRPAIPGKWTALRSRYAIPVCDPCKCAFFRQGWGRSANVCYSDMYIHPPPYKKIYSCEASIWLSAVA